MNITHATEEKIEGDRLKAIFERQKQLMEKYHHIEAASGLCQTSEVPVNLNDKRGQARIKDFAWRITEELGEALDASSDLEHRQEELIDGLHFLTELTILSGKDYDSLIPNFCPQDTGEVDCLEMIYEDSKELEVDNLLRGFIMNLGMLCNCLKNKPWKQTHMKTDIAVYYQRLEKVWTHYVGLMRNSGMTTDEIAMVYLKKAQVNSFRQRSNY